MKIMTLNFTAFNLKALLIFFCITVGFASFTKCDAQAFIGKWKQVSAKTYCTPEAVKRSHCHLQAIQDMPLPEDVIDEFYANKTTRETITGNGTKKVESGTWNLTGDHLKITRKEGQELTYTIVSVIGSTLVLAVEMPKTPNMSVIKREFTFTKM